jgi:hypothetical protein
LTHLLELFQVRLAASSFCLLLLGRLGLGLNGVLEPLQSSDPPVALSAAAPLNLEGQVALGEAHLWQQWVRCDPSIMEAMRTHGLRGPLGGQCAQPS